MKNFVGPVIRKLKNIEAFNRLLDRVFINAYQLPVKPLHYYSPVPDIDQLKNNIERWYRRGNWSAIDLNVDGQLRLLDDLQPFSSEYEKLPSFAEIAMAGYGPGYGEVEAHLLHCILRYLKPRRVIEVGSGLSTYFIAAALEQNRTETQTESNLVCIEPFPNTKLEELIALHGGVLKTSEVQDVEPSLFEMLQPGDVLFIDSTHVSKLGSDVNFLYLDVLPLLQQGVWVHIHDIPFPYLSAPPEHPLFDLYLLWNEAALVKGFLMYNSAFTIRISQSYLHHEHPDSLANFFGAYDRTKHFPLSLWLEKVK